MGIPTTDSEDSSDFHKQETDNAHEAENARVLYEAKISALIRKNSLLEDQLASTVVAREAAEKNLSAALKNKNEVENKLAEVSQEVELLKEKLAGIDLVQEEANSLSNSIHSDNVRLEHDVAFLKAILDDTQKVSGIYSSVNTKILLEYSFSILFNSC